MKTSLAAIRLLGLAVAAGGLLMSRPALAEPTAPPAPTFLCRYTPASPPANPRSYVVDLVGGALPGTCKVIELRKGSLPTGPVDLQGQTAQFGSTTRAVFWTTEFSNGPMNTLMNKESVRCTAVITNTDCPTAPH